MKRYFQFLLLIFSFFFFFAQNASPWKRIAQSKITFAQQSIDKEINDNLMTIYNNQQNNGNRVNIIENNNSNNTTKTETPKTDKQDDNNTAKTILGFGATILEALLKKQ